jgi:hypothetical protein
MQQRGRRVCWRLTPGLNAPDALEVSIATGGAIPQTEEERQLAEHQGAREWDRDDQGEKVSR